MLWLWLPLAFLVLALVVGTALCALQALRAYRQLRSLRRAVLGELSGFDRRLGQMRSELEAAAAAVARLTAALERLAVSRARLAVLGRALRLGTLSRGLRLLGAL
jgi:alkylation response protein AidB-like acyl-CoA dehydrogenase